MSFFIELSKFQAKINPSSAQSVSIACKTFAYHYALLMKFLVASIVLQTSGRHAFDKSYFLRIFVVSECSNPSQAGMLVF